MNFYSAAFKEIIDALGNDFNDNWDHVRFGEEKSISLRKKLKLKTARMLNRLGLVRINDFKEILLLAEKQIAHFDELYKRLENQESKDLLVKIFAYRILGHKRIKLPLSTPKYWNDLRKIEQLATPDDTIDPKFSGFLLQRINLEKIGYPLELYFTPSGILIDFVIKQYEYHHNAFSIKAESGDVVIDGGGCWGDTALFFANAVGPEGRVYSFEFVPFNLGLFERNISLNPAMANRVSLIQNPLWGNSGTNVYMKENGPASKVSLDPFQGQTGTVKSVSIDDFVQENRLARLDFIKLDIEGAELKVLQGAVNSLKRYKPKLAVALYHYPEDFETIPRYIESLGLGYKFYLSHCTINKEETILFATA